MKDRVISKFIQANKNLKNKIRFIYLFGSRARGDEKPYSDYDLLLIVSENFTLADKDSLYDHVMDILLATGAVISLKIFKEGEFSKLRELGTPFIRNVLKEGVKVG